MNAVGCFSLLSPPVASMASVRAIHQAHVTRTICHHFRTNSPYDNPPRDYCGVEAAATIVYSSAFARTAVKWDTIRIRADGATPHPCLRWTDNLDSQ
jgi:hypothetical protein